MNNPFTDNEQSQVRLAHLRELEALTGLAYPNKFERSNILQSSYGADTISGLVAAYGRYSLHNPDGTPPNPEAVAQANEALKPLNVRIAGRLATTPRTMGKAAFVHLSDGAARLQIYVRKQEVVGVSNSADNALAIDGWMLFKLLDGGDIIGVEGFLFVTQKGELSVHVQRVQFLAKALLPLPDKMHGISDPELRRRQRYADLIADSLKIEREPHEITTREVFVRRAKLITTMRRFLDDAGYLEVETPMLAPLATGAAARAFATHHNALDIPLYARIAPELYLKRLVVGGFERVYELNRNFRNEGISHKHNPEFTMLEFYCAYMNVNGMMDFCEKLLQHSVLAATGGLQVEFDGQEIDFSKFERVRMSDIVPRYAPAATVVTEANMLTLFDEFVEPQLIQPTFIVDYPKAISPLSKASPENPQIAERFELFIAGMECANGFSELNDPAEQRQRFLDQMNERDAGDDEAMVLDDDYIRALSYGMPPAAGIGIGIDRLVMLLTNRHSIRDVILFPHLRPE